MTGQAESSGMRDSLAINEEHIRPLTDPFCEHYEKGTFSEPKKTRTFSEPKKTRNILGGHTIDDCRGLNDLHVRRVPDGGSDKGRVTLVCRVHSTQVSRLEVSVVDAFDAC